MFTDEELKQLKTMIDYYTTEYLNCDHPENIEEVTTIKNIGEKLLEN